MSHILIVEPEVSTIRVLQTAIESLAEEYKIIAFSSGPDLLSWLTRQIEDKKQNGDHPSYTPVDIRLIILDSHMVTDGKTNLIEPIHNKLISEELTNPENPCGFVFTFFESSDFNLESYIHPLVYNVVFKPFDSLLLKESLKSALNGHQAVQPDVYTHDATGKVEILKNITTTAITEIGFRTQSAREIPIGKKARYYSPLFRTDKTEYVYAFCYANRPDPNYPEKFISSFSYFGVSKEQLRSIRKFIHKNENHTSTQLEDVVSDEDEQTVIVVTRTLDIVNNIRAIVKEKFKQVTVLHAPSFNELNIALGRTDEQISHGETSFKADQTITIQVTKVGFQIKNILIDNNLLEDNHLFLGTSAQELTKSNKPVQSLTLQKDQALLGTYLRSPLLEQKPIVGIPTEEGATNYFKIIDYIEVPKEKSNKAKDEQNLMDLILAPLSASELKAHLGIKEIQLNNVEAVLFEIPEEPAPYFLQAIKNLSIEVKEKGHHTALFALAHQQITSYESLQQFDFLNDYIVLPVDSFYFSHKLKQLFPQTICIDENGLSREGIEEQTVIQTALPVNVKRVSELHITISHNRALKLGDVRRFVLFLPNENVLPEVWGSCNYITESSPKEFIHEFIFFGVTDRNLKLIRNWMKFQYIKAKSK